MREIRFGTLPSTRTMNLQAALFLAWSYTLYLIMFAPSLKSVSGSWPTSITLQRDENCKQRGFHHRMWNKGKLPHTPGIYQQCLLQPEGPRSPERWVFQVLQTSVWTGDTWSLEGRYLETCNKEGNSLEDNRVLEHSMKKEKEQFWVQSNDWRNRKGLFLWDWNHANLCLRNNNTKIEAATQMCWKF